MARGKEEKWLEPWHEEKHGTRKRGKMAEAMARGESGLGVGLIFKDHDT